MICPKCGRETAGNFCSNCGASLQAENNLYRAEKRDSQMEDFNLNEDFDLEDLFAKEDDFPREASFSRTSEPVQRELLNRERSYVREKQEPAAPVRAPRSHKNTEKEKSHKKEKVKKVVETRETKETRADRESGKSRREKNSRFRTDENSENPDGRGKRRSRRNPEEEVGRRGAVETVEAAGESLGNAVVKGAVGVLVLSSRVMQIVSCLLMAAMVWKMANVFLRSGDELGALESMITDRNYGLALYVAAAGITLVMGAIWCLWILSRKSGGGEIRMKKYDVGRGFFPFLICLGVVYALGVAAPWVLAETESLGNLAGGVISFLTAVNGQSGFLFFCCSLGAVLSFVRKLLRV